MEVAVGTFTSPPLRHASETNHVSGTMGIIMYMFIRWETPNLLR
jgi:hypothetical protein